MSTNSWRFVVAVGVVVLVLVAIRVNRTNAMEHLVDGWFAPAERLNPPDSPKPSGPPEIVPGDCNTVAALFDYYDPSGASSAFFVGQGIAWRETRCGIDVLNEATGDTGIVQLNPVHNRAGYFGGRYFGAGGWLGTLHGLTTRNDIRNPEWANAAITLRQVCGNGPWNPGNYWCAYNRLEWPR